LPLASQLRLRAFQEGIEKYSVVIPPNARVRHSRLT
jgi:hypothetical protein